MGTSSGEFNVTGANLLSTLQTLILGSTDWARPNSGVLPTLFKCTTTRGAQMAIDLNTTAVDLNKMSLTAYRTHDGTTAVDPTVSFIRHKRTTGGAFATNTYHGFVSAGKEHFFLYIEGPRAGETGADSATYGSLRNYVFLNDLVPYHAADTTPAVVLGGPQTNVAPTLVANMHQVRVSRNAADSLAWNPGHLTSLQFPMIAAANFMNEKREAVSDSGNFYMSPYVLWDNTDGERGRLASFFYAGSTFADVLEATVPPIGQNVTYGGATYKLIQVNKSDTSEQAWGPLGLAANAGAALMNYSPVIAVPV